MRLEAFCQMSSFLAKMEEKSSGLTVVAPQFPALLQSVQLQFLSGCFSLGSQILGSHTEAYYEIQHYLVKIMGKNPPKMLPAEMEDIKLT